MPEKTPTETRIASPYDVLTTLNASQLEIDRKWRMKKGGNNRYVIPSDTTVLVSARLRDDKTISEDLGFLNFTDEEEVQLLGSGSSIKVGLVGKNLGFFGLNLDNIPQNSVSIVDTSKPKRGRRKKGSYILSALQRFYFKHNAYKDLKITEHDPEHFGILVFTVKLQGQLDLH